MQENDRCFYGNCFALEEGYYVDSGGNDHNQGCASGFFGRD